MLYAGWCGVVLPGVTYPMIFRAGTWYISKHSVGFVRESLRRWCTICVWRCACFTSVSPPPVLRFTTAAPCLQRQKAERERSASGVRAECERSASGVQRTQENKWLEGSSAQRAPAVDTLGHLLALKVTPANEDDRTQVEALSQELQEAVGQSVEIAFVDQGYTGEDAAQQAEKHGIKLCVVKLEEAKRGFVLLPKRWVVERSFAWATRFRRLAKDYERLPETVAGLHFLAFACLMLKQCFAIIQSA